MNPTHRNLLTLAVLLLILSAALYAIGAIRLNTNLQAGDQGAYLHLSLAQKAGIQLTDGNRHPLYSTLLIPFADRVPEFFSRARWLSFFIGMFFLAFISWNEIRNRNDPLAALLVLAFLGLHLQVVRTLSEIWCEPLLYLLVFLLWSILDRADRGAKKEIISTRFTVSGGVLTGLVYLCKGTGLQVAVLFWVTVFIFAKQRTKPLIGVGIFLLISSPLLVWNLVTYENPIYSFASTHNMWFDEADEIWYDDAEDLPTLGSYLKTHTTGEIFGRAGRGLILESRMAFGVLWSDWKLPEGSSIPATFLLTGFKILIVAGIGFGMFRRFGNEASSSSICSKPSWVFFLLMLLFMFPAFGWYAQLTNAPRFLMTLVPIAIVLGSRWIIQSLLPSTTEGRQRYSRVIVTLVLIFSLFSLTQTASFAWKTRSVHEPSLDPLAERILQEVNELPDSATIAFGPSHGLPLWLSRTDLKWRPTPWRIDLERFRVMVDRERIGYVLLDGETLARRPYLTPLAGPAASQEFGWPLVARFRSDTGFFLLYEVSQ